MANEPLKRNRYAYPPSQECKITGSNLNRDFDDYHLPHSRLTLASLQDWGIAQGGEITGTIGSTEITVNSGAALNRQGQLIWLASNGSGTLNINPPTKVPVPVKLNTSSYLRAEDTAYYITITFFEWEQREVGRPCDRVLEQVPWIQLQPVSGDSAYVDDDASVVLGQVVIDSKGKLKELKPDGRRLVGKTVEQLNFQRADKAENKIHQVSAAKIKPASNGGLQITVSEATDQVLLQKEGGGNFAQLAVQANTLDVTGNVQASGILQGNSLQLSAGATMNGPLTIQNALTVSGNVDIGGNLKVSGNLEVQGNVIARDTEHIAGNVSLGDADNDEVKITGIVRSGHSSRTLRVDDALHTTGPLTVDGNLGIGTTAPSEKLEVAGDVKITGARLKSANGWGMIETNQQDWLRINPDQTYPAIALYKPVAIGTGGLAIGEWGKPPQGELHVTQGAFLAKEGGNVGIGTLNPQDKLDVAGNLRILTDSNPIRFTSAWSGFPDGPNVTNQAEICNDTTRDKTLMIVGNKSGDGKTRKVSIWDRLEVNGSMKITGNLTIQEALNVTGDVTISGSRLISKDGYGILETNQTDWLRINREGNYPAIALHKPVAIGNGGLAIGEWGKPPVGELHVTQGAFLAKEGGNVGIGTYQPQGKLDVRGDIRAGNSDIYFTKTDHDHSAIGNTAGYAAIENASNYEALMILGRAGTSKGRYVKLWDYLQVIGGMDITGNVGIGTTNPGAALDVNGWIYISGGNGLRFYNSNKSQYWHIYPEWRDVGDPDLMFDFSGKTRETSWVRGWLDPQGGWNAPSDKRLKQNIEPFSHVLERVMQLQPKFYHWINTGKNSTKSFGFIAQEVEKVFPDFVTEKSGIKAIKYNDFSVLAIAAIQEQQELFTQLKEEITNLKEQVQKLTLA